MSTVSLTFFAILAIGFVFLLYRIWSILKSKKKLLNEKYAEFESPYILVNQADIPQSFDQPQSEPTTINSGGELSFERGNGVISNRIIPENLNSRERKTPTPSIQDSVITGDSLVGSTKIESQTFNDADAIARAAGAAAVDAYRIGLDDRS